MPMSLPVAAFALAALVPRSAFALRSAPSRSASLSLLFESSKTHSLSYHHRTQTKRCLHSSTTALQGGYNMDAPNQAQFWNRETSKPSLEHEGKVTREARIIALCDPEDPNNEPLYKGPLPEGSKLLAVGSSAADFDGDSIAQQEPNVIFVSHPKAREPLVQLLEKFPSVEWVHSRSAGIDFITSPGLAQSDVLLTNSKGMFSSTLAEYCMMTCSYFAKDLPRLLRQKDAGNWEQYPILELRGATLGVIGFGDIGRASAKLAKAYGMKVLGIRRSPKQSMYDPYCDEIYGMEGLRDLMGKSDYILISTPLTDQTKGLISAEVLSFAKPTAVIINVGRGPIIDEEALIEALQERKIKGAGLDVTTIEPLPKESPLWKLDNVLLSPHNMDMTQTFMRESTEFFVNENLPRFLRGTELFNPSDKVAGY